MKNTISMIFLCAFGSTVGGFIGYKIAKRKYEKLADKEVESVLKAFEELREKDKNKNTKKIEKNEKPEITREDKQKYIDYSKPYRTETADNRISGTPSNSKKSKKEESAKPTKPYIITPEEFKESYYESKTLFYYADKYLTDDEYHLIENSVELIGPEALTQFGVYEEDAVYVRDDLIGVDYEILLDERLYKKIASKIKPSGKVEPIEN